MHLLTALACAALLAGGPADAQSQDQIDAARAGAAQFTDAELIASLREGFDEMAPGRYQLLRDNFPDEVRTLERRIVTEARAGRLNTAAAQSLGYQFMADLYATHGSAMGKAPVDELVAALRSQLDTLILMREVNLVGCRELGEEGMLSEATAVSLSPRVLKALGSYSDAQFKALIAGMRSPVEHGSLTQGDLEAILAAFGRRGGDLRVLGAMGTPDIATFSSAERCDATISLMQAVLDQPPALVARFIAFSHSPSAEIPHAS